jgi:uncharacterized phage infection (PIP) family protein YhgE
MFQSFQQFSQSVVEADTQPGAKPSGSEQGKSSSNDPELEKFKNDLVALKGQVEVLISSVDALDSSDAVTDPAKQKAAISKIMPTIQKTFTGIKQSINNMKVGFTAVKGEINQIKSGKPEETKP